MMEPGEYCYVLTLSYGNKLHETITDTGTWTVPAEDWTRLDVTEALLSSREDYLRPPRRRGRAIVLFLSLEPN